MKNRIPIFPLKLVLFPESRYPLHIFEERYKKLTARCIETGESFGIVTNIDSNFSKIGCIATIDKVIKTYPNGSFDILVYGVERFKTKSTILASDGYLEADIIPFQDDEQLPLDEKLYNRTTDKLLEVLKTAKVELDSDFWANLTVAEIKSFKLAEKAGLNLKQQQMVLSFRNEKARLNYLYEHLSKIESLIEKSKATQKLIAGDGYINI